MRLLRLLPKRPRMRRPLLRLQKLRLTMSLLPHWLRRWLKTLLLLRLQSPLHLKLLLPLQRQQLMKLQPRLLRLLLLLKRQQLIRR